MELEKLGVPTITVCTDAFVALAREESKNLGMPDLPIAIVKHPLGGEPEDGITERSLVALDQVIEGLSKDLM